MKFTSSSFGLFAAFLCAASLIAPGVRAQPSDAGSRNFLESKARAKKGDLEGIAGLGLCYQMGQGVAQDHVEAVKWFRKAAEQNYVLGQWRLGGCYMSGRGVAKDDAEGVKWLRLAADQNLGPAQTELGSAYLFGFGVARDDGEAAKWYRKAAEQDWSEAQFALGGCYLQGRGVTKDYVEAYAWWSVDTSPARTTARHRDGLEKEMSPQQIAAGKKRAEELRAQIAAQKVERKAAASSAARPAAIQPSPTVGAVPGSTQRSASPPLTPQPPVSAAKTQAAVELTGVIGFLSTPKALLEITTPSGSVKSVTVKVGDRVDSIEVVQIDVKSGQVTIRNAGTESVLRLKGK